MCLACDKVLWSIYQHMNVLCFFMIWVKIKQATYVCTLCCVVISYGCLNSSVQQDWEKK